MMKSIAKKIMFHIVSFLPKLEIVVLKGYPDFDDNLLSIYTELIKRDIYKIVWVVENRYNEPPFCFKSNTRLVTRRSLKDFFYSSICKYIFITHGHFIDQPPRNQIIVNLWHGIPFKKIGNLLVGKSRIDSYLVATSSFTKDIFKMSFDTPTSNILITGQPRTDRMLNVNREEIFKKIFTEYKSINSCFLWLPTYRINRYNKEFHVDGIDIGNLLNCSDFSLIEFNEILKRNDNFCIVKPHPLAVRRNCANLSNILFVDEDWLTIKKLSLYQLIGASDCLISDISSVIVDYLLLDRPIVLLFEDIDQYETNRGFILNPISKYLPSRINTNFKDFIEDIESVCKGEDTYFKERFELRSLYFDYTDSSSAQRVLDIVIQK